MIILEIMMSLLKSVIRHEKVKFLIIGGYNTLFSLILGNLMYYFLPLNYTIIAIALYIISVTNSYMTYKIFLFKTKGNILKELIRANITYLSTFCLNLFLMFVFVSILQMEKIIAFNIASVIVVIVIYTMHKFFTFKQ